MANPKLTQEQMDELRGEMVANGVPTRFLHNGCNLNVCTGETMSKGTAVIHQVAYWCFKEETVDKIAEWLGCKAIYSKTEVTQHE